MGVLFVAGIFSIIIGIFMFLLIVFNNKKQYLNLTKKTKNDYAIIIPARYESNVIKNLLDSIKVQNNDMSNVYIIVESKEDETCNISQEYGCNIFVRKQPIRPRKGYALDECLKEILKVKTYDLYFIFDADNTLDKNYINHMLNSFKEGYDIAIGYRNISNPVNAVAVCSGLTFSIINTIINAEKIKNNTTVILSGTGFYISGKLVKKWNGFPFNSLTEDYELSLYASINNISTTYNNKAIFNDEQPVLMKTSIKQRVRWIRGFLESRKLRLKNNKVNLSKKLGILPYLLVILGIILILIKEILIISLLTFFQILMSIYVFLILFTLFLLKKEKYRMKLNNKLFVKVLLYNPIFLISYIRCFLISVFKKDIVWEKIDHQGK